MGYETYANKYITNLAGNGGSIGSGTTTINIASGTGAPSGQSRFLIDNELIIGSVSGTVLTASTRGAEGTVAVSHNDGASVACVLTAASLLVASPENETQAGRLINATSTGDAGNRATHFTDGALPAGWTATHASGGATPAVFANSVLSDIASSDADSFMRPFTPSGNFRIEARVNVVALNTVGGSGGIAVGVSDSVSTVSGTPNSAFGFWSPHQPVQAIYTQDGSTSLTDRADSTAAIYTAGWLYLAFYRVGGTFFFDLSVDRASWLSINSGSGYTTAKTVNYLGVYVPARSIVAVDFVDVVS